MRRILLITVAGLAALGALGGGAYTAFWASTANSARASVLAWVATLQAEGFKASVGEVGASGFPGRILLTIDDLVLARVSSALPWHWQVDGIDASIQLMEPNQIVLRPHGRQSIRYGAGDAETTIQVSARRLTLQLGIGENGTLSSLALDAVDLDLANADGTPPTTAGRFQLRANLADGLGAIPNGSTFSVRFDSLVMPKYTRGPLGNTIEVLQANLELRRSLTSTDLPVALASWREAEGSLRVNESRLQWGTLDFTGHGGFTLDELLRPEGTITAEIRGYVVTVDAFHAAGRLNDEERASIDAMLSFLRQRGPLGSISLPVHANQGQILVGPVSLGTVQPILPLAGSAD